MRLISNGRPRRCLMRCQEMSSFSLWIFKIIMAVAEEWPPSKWTWPTAIPQVSLIVKMVIVKIDSRIWASVIIHRSRECKDHLMEVGIIQAWSWWINTGKPCTFMIHPIRSVQDNKCIIWMRTRIWSASMVRFPKIASAHLASSRKLESDFY